MKSNIWIHTRCIHTCISCTDLTRLKSRLDSFTNSWRGRPKRRLLTLFLTSVSVSVIPLISDISKLISNWHWPDIDFSKSKWTDIELTSGQCQVSNYNNYWRQEQHWSREKKFDGIFEYCFEKSPYIENEAELRGAVCAKVDPKNGLSHEHPNSKSKISKWASSAVNFSILTGIGS